MSPTHLPKDPSQGPDLRLWQVCGAIKRQLTAASASFASTVSDPIVPLIVLGAIVAHVIAICVFDAPAVGFGILSIGGLTAFLEAKKHKDRDDC